MINQQLLDSVRKDDIGFPEIWRDGPDPSLTWRPSRLLDSAIEVRYRAGNHDRLKGARGKAYESQFEEITGTEATWQTHARFMTDVLDGRVVQVLVSHKPKENLWGADVSVFGHVHNNVVFPGEGHHPEDDWSFSSDVHFCACVELHDGIPRTLQELADAKRAGYPLALPAVDRYRVLHPNGGPERKRS